MSGITQAIIISSISVRFIKHAGMCSIGQAINVRETGKGQEDKQGFALFSFDHLRTTLLSRWHDKHMLSSMCMLKLALLQTEHAWMFSLSRVILKVCCHASSFLDNAASSRRSKFIRLCPVPKVASNSSGFSWSDLSPWFSSASLIASSPVSTSSARLCTFV